MNCVAGPSAVGLRVRRDKKDFIDSFVFVCVCVRASKEELLSGHSKKTTHGSINVHEIGRYLALDRPARRSRNWFVPVAGVPIEALSDHSRSLLAAYQ